MEFVKDLRQASLGAAKLLREKSARLNKEGVYADSLYSSEAEFTAKVYRRLALLEENYINDIFVDYYRPKKTEKKPPRAEPDIVYHDRNGERIVVEIKVIVDLKKRDRGLIKGDKDNIIGDYEQLRDVYTKFDRKILLVAFLGDPGDYDEANFSSEVNKLVNGNSNVEVITC